MEHNLKSWIGKFTFYFPIVYCLMLIGYISILHFNNGLLFSRVGLVASGHTFVWIIILFFAVFFRLGISNERPVYGFFRWVATMMFVIAVIELVFQVAYIISDPSRMYATMIPDFEILIGITIGGVMKVYNLFDYKWLSLYVAFILIWLMIGLPVTVSIKNLNPMTEFYYSPIVNSIEIMQWFIGLLMFAIGFNFEVDLWNIRQVR